MRSYEHLAIAVVCLGGLVDCGVRSSDEWSTTSEPLTADGGSAALTYSSDWTSGYCANAVVSNNGSATATSWVVVIDLNQSTLTGSWNANMARSGSQLTFTPLGWNASLAPGKSTSFGFCANATGANYKPSIVSVVLTRDHGAGGSTGTGGAATGGAGGSGGRGGSGGGGGGGAAGSPDAALGGGGGAAGSPDGGTPVNAKALNTYGQRDVFLVSDSDWRRVLTTLPAAIWTDTDGTTTKNPLLLFHDERNSTGGFDAEAALHFLGEYKTTVAGPRLHVFETLPAELRAAVPSSWTVVEHTDAREFWQSFADVVYVPNDYQTAMNAAPYAALINAPLLVQGYNDAGVDLSSRHAICIGLTQTACSETLTIDQLQRRYVQTTNTNKVILTRPVTSLFAADSPVVVAPSTHPIANFFGATSLVAPILAAAKQEVIVSINAQAADTVDAQLDSTLRNLALTPRYLTIVASPLEIQQTKVIAYGTNSYWSVDAAKYGNLDNDANGFAEARTGRIYGLTSSDTSTYVARASFRADLPRPNPDSYLFVGNYNGAPGTNNAEYDAHAQALAGLFSTKGTGSFRTATDQAIAADWANKTLINDSGHGSIRGASIYATQVPWMASTVYLSMSCQTCAFDLLTSDITNSYCMQLMRRGALGATVSVDFNGFVWDGMRLNRALGSDLGAVTKSQQNYDHARLLWYEDFLLLNSKDHSALAGDIQFLLGDPTVSMGSSGAFLPDPTIVITPAEGGVSIDLTAPSITMSQADHFLFMEGLEDRHRAADLAQLVERVGPMPAATAKSVSSPDVVGDVLLVATQKDTDGTYWYLVFRKDFSANPVGSVVDNKIHFDVQY